MLQPKKPLDLTSAKQILEEERKPLDLSSAEAILKKKDGTKEPLTSTTQTAGTESVQTDGFSDLQKRNLNKFDLDSNDLKKISADKKIKIGTKESEETLKKVIQREVETQEFKNSVNQKLANYRQATKVSPQEREEAVIELNEVKKQEGLLNNIKAIGSQFGNFITTGAFKKEDPLLEEKKEAKQFFIDNKIKATPEQIEKKADELFLNKKILSKKQDKINEYLGSLSPAEKIYLKANAQEKFESIPKKRKEITDRIAMNKNAFNQLLEESKKPMTLEDKSLIDSELLKIAKYLDQDYKEVNKITNELGTVKDELDIFKRNYDFIDNANSRIVSSIANIGADVLSGIDYLSKYTMPIGSEARTIKVQEGVEKAKGEIQNYKEQFRPDIQELNSDNWANYLTDLFANQSGTLLAIGTTGGVGGASILGVGQAGQTYSDMYKENRKSAKYNPLQMALAPLVSGVSTGYLSALPTGGTLKNAANVWKSALKTSEGKALTNQAISNTSKSITNQVLGDIGKEVSTELLDNTIQNAIKRDILEDKSVGYFDNSWQIIKDTALLTGMLNVGAAPQITMSAVKMFNPPNINKILDSNGAKIIELSKELDKVDLDENARKLVQTHISELTKSSSKIIDDTMKKIDGLTEDEVKKVVQYESKKEKLVIQAKEIKENPELTDQTKKVILQGLEEQYKDSTEKSNEIINAETKKPIIQEKQESQPQAEEQTQVAEVKVLPKENDEVVLESLMKNGLPRTMIFKEGEWKQKVGGQISSISQSAKLEAQNKFDETQTQGDVVVDGDIRPTSEQIGEVAVTEQPTTEVTETEVVESAVEPRASEEDVKVKQLDEKQFFKKYKAVHKDVRSKTEQEKKITSEKIKIEGFQEGYNVNALPLYKGVEKGTDITSDWYKYKKGDVVYLLPKEAYQNKSNGFVTKKGYIPSEFEVVTIQYDGQSAYEAYKQQFSKSEPTRKEKRKKAVEDTVDNWADSIKGLESVFGIKIKADTGDVKIQGTSRDQLIDFIAKTAKEIAKTGIEIDEAIRSVIAELRKSYVLDIEVEEVKNIAEPKQEPRETFVAEKGKHSVLLRLSKGDNPQREIDAINRADFDYDVRKQRLVDREAENFVKDVGISQAYKALKEGKIEKFDTAALIYNAILQQMPKEHDALIAEMTNEDDIMRAEEAYANEFAQVSKDFSVFETKMGQGISVMNYIYNKNEDIRYELSRQKEAYKASNNGVIPKDVLEKYEKASKRLEEVNKLIKEKEAELAEIENTVLVQEIEKSIKRQKQASQKSKTSLTDAQLKRKRELSKKFFRANDITSFATILLDPEFREYLGLSFKEAKGDLEAFTKRVLKEIGNAYKPHISEMFDAATEVNEQLQANSIKLSKDGKITVPKSVIENLIEKGFDNINSISEEVLRIMSEKHPELTLRQVKESIVGYGRDVAKTRTDIEIEIGRLKRIGQLELEIEDLENGIVKIKNEKKQIQQSSKIQDLIAKKRQLENDLGIAEEKRLDRTKGYTKRRIAELKKRISEGDFSKKEVKPVRQDAELRKLRMEKTELQETFDKERYKLELKNRSKAKKLFDSIFDVLNIKRVGLTTGEFSPMFVQGGALTVRNILRNPKQFLADFKSMMKAMADTKYYKQTEQDIKSSDIFDIIRDSKLGIVETDTKQSAKEELFQHQILESVFDYGAEQVVKLLKPILTEKYGEKRAEEISNNIEKITKEYVLILRPFERANNAYMNSLRYNRFKEGVQMLQAEGKNPIDNLEDYKRVASAINTLTGRSNLGALEQYKQGLGLIFFSAKLMASTWQKVNPMHYWALRDSENWKKPSVAQKMLFVDALTHYVFMASVTLLMKSVYNALKDDDDKEATVEIDPRSSDFMKFKVGNARLDYFGTGLAPFVLFSRLYTEEVMKADGEIYKMGESGTKSRGEYIGNYFVNKLNPLTAGVYKYINTTEKEFEGKTFREDNWGRDFDYVDYMTDIMPIIYGTGKEVLEEQPNLFGGLIMLQAAFGVNPSVYGNEDKGIKNEPDLDEQGNPREKSSSQQRPTRPSMPKRPERP